MTLLENRTAIVHGGSGSVGSAVARAFAREGATVHLTGRTGPPSKRWPPHPGSGRVAHVDVLDAWTAPRSTACRRGHRPQRRHRLCFNATYNDDVQGTPLVDMSLDDLMQPVAKAVTSTFTVATAAARHMVGRGSGAILVMGGGREAYPQPRRLPRCLGRARGAVPPLAAELGPHGVRVAWLLSPGSPEPGRARPGSRAAAAPRRRASTRSPTRRIRRVRLGRVDDRHRDQPHRRRRHRLCPVPRSAQIWKEVTFID